MIAEAVARWRSMPAGTRLRWTDPEGWHITLASLGSTDPARVPAVTEAVRLATADFEAFIARLDGVRAFPASRAARVLAIRLLDDDERLARLANAVRRAVGIEDPSRFEAHVTLARARGKPEDLRHWVDSLSAPTGDVRVECVALYRSHLGRGPVRYESLRSIHLAEPSLLNA